MAFLWLTTDGRDGISVQETAGEVRSKFEDSDAPRFVGLMLTADEDEDPWRKVYIDRDSVYAIEQGHGIDVEDYNE